MTSARRSRAPRWLALAAIVAIVTLGVWWGTTQWFGDDAERGVADGGGAAIDAGVGAAGAPGTTTSSPDAPRAGAETAPRSSILSPEPSFEVVAPSRTSEPAIADGAAPESVTAAGGDKGPIDDGAPSGATDPASPAGAATGAVEAPGAEADSGDSAPLRATPQPQLDAAIALATSDPVRSRRELTQLLDSSALDTAQRRRAYDAINEVNRPLFASGMVQGDPVFSTHRVAEGETAVFIVRALGAKCDSDLLLRINGIADARRMRPGQMLKVPKDAFHAEVRKGEFRLNVFHGVGADRVMVASYPVGLGEFNTTPTGIFKVRPRSKLKDPQWRNPRTGEQFASNDPKNPIGERWIGLEGIEPHNQDFAGYGIHGTIEPESIGQMRSMGCIRMLAPDVEVVYEMLTVPDSTVLIAP